jgi:hypothetical protein
MQMTVMRRREDAGCTKACFIKNIKQILFVCIKIILPLA